MVGLIFKYLVTRVLAVCEFLDRDLSFLKISKSAITSYQGTNLDVRFDCSLLSLTAALTNQVLECCVTRR